MNLKKRFKVFIPVLASALLILFFQNCGRNPQFKTTSYEDGNFSGSVTQELDDVANAALPAQQGYVAQASYSQVLPTLSGLTIAAGWNHTCAISDGKLSCWGKNDSGQVGNGATSDVVSPYVVRASGVSQVAGGENHTCAVISAALYCWGKNDQKQIPYWNGATSLTPFPSVSSGVARVDAGGNQACYLSTGGALFCWGLGNAITQVFSSGVTKFAVGGAHVCAVKDNKLYCWGDNSKGQLGDGTLRAKSSPVGISLTGIVELYAGATSTCAKLSGGELKCWGVVIPKGGYRYVQQCPQLVLFAGATAEQIAAANEGYTACQERSMAELYGYNLLPTTFIASAVERVSLGREHACAILGSGQLQCWGHNGSGELALPIKVRDPMLPDAEDPNKYFLPQTIIASGVTDVAAGADHTCVVMDNTSVKCFGNSGFGQLGYGNKEPVLSVPVATVPNIDPPAPPPPPCSTCPGGFAPKLNVLVNGPYTSNRPRGNTVYVDGVGIFKLEVYGACDTQGLPGTSGQQGVLSDELMFFNVQDFQTSYADCTFKVTDGVGQIFQKTIRFSHY